ncbi:hypothetical protein NBO_29g0037 [Nosema bombycis CQ1]|uniref:Thioredoxin n=1 Tax=Nosema bombycis (strain CQ1 / CVCC 102059) TaxID=578461 RepID=R0MJH6_NOSB1|nr:hypothetical protein NBO_29g0037 [Nosema bombycis CQ1]|eukprot:EOB14355.1 hypothetical protein NBO_29g0037 [Nosema bombycis CQ1]
MPLTVYKYAKKEQVEEKIKSLQTGAVIVFGIRPCGPCTVLESFINSWRPEISINLFELKAPEFEDMEDYRKKFDLKLFPTVSIVDKNMKIVETQIIPGGNKNVFINLVMKHKSLFE